MEVLVVDNSAMSIVNGRYCTNSMNGGFVVDIKNEGNDVSYFHFAYSDQSPIKSFDLQANGIRCVPIKLFKNKLFRYLYAYAKLFIEIAKTDFAYFYYPGSFKYGTFMCKILGKRYGLYIRGMQGIDSKLSRRIYKNAYVLFTVSDHFTNMVNEVVGRKVGNTIRPMIPYTDNDILWDREYFIKDKVRILYLGRVTQDKGMVELLHAIKIVCDRGYDVVLDIVGDGEFMTQTNQLMKDLGLEDTVFLRGAITDEEIKKQFFVNSDIYILPTWHEGFPRTLYEAMIYGTPIITTFVGGIPAIMKDAINCVQIQPKSVDSIVDRLIWSINNYDNMKSMAHNGFYTVKKIVDKNRLTHGQHLSKIIAYGGK